MTQAEINERFPKQLAVVKYFERIRWGNKPKCAYCGSKNLSKRLKDLRFKCYNCKRTSSVTTGTFLHGTNVSLYTWLKVFSFISYAEKGITAGRLKSEDITDTYITAWGIFYKVRDIMSPEFKDGTIIATAKIAYPGNLKSRFKEKKYSVDQALRIKGKKVKILDVTQPPDDARFSKIMIYISKYDISAYFSTFGISKDSISSFWAMIERQVRINHNPIELKYLHKYIQEAIFQINPQKGINIFETLVRNSMKNPH